MQGTVQFDSAAINYQPPFVSRILILYLIVVTVVWVVRSLSVLRVLWAFRRAPFEMKGGDELLDSYQVCSNRVQSMKRLAFVTLLWTVLVATLQLRSNLAWVVSVKAFLPAGLVGGVLEAIDISVPGIAAAAVLYSASVLYAGAMQRAKKSWDRRNRDPVSAEG